MKYMIPSIVILVGLMILVANWFDVNHTYTNMFLCFFGAYYIGVLIESDLWSE